MALENPMVTSPAGSAMSALSPHTEFSLSPDTPDHSRFQILPIRNSTDSSLRPYSSIDRNSFPINNSISPSDMVGPSPVTSNGTDGTEIEDEASEEAKSPPSVHGSVDSHATLRGLSTNVPDHLRASLDDEVVSVIHAPEGYKGWSSSKESRQKSPPRFADRSSPKHSPPERSVARMPQKSDRSTPTPYQEGDIDPPISNKELPVPHDKSQTTSPTPISTDVPPVKFSVEAPTPRAQTWQELEGLLNGNRSSASLEGIPEELREEDEFEQRTVHNSDQEIQALNTALNECWTLCNTLASLSSIHRERIFSYSGTGDAHEKAWKCCWRLCQKLYESRDDDHEDYVRPTLDMCRDFCQALFDVRQRKDETADSVLRVSFELNNHLFNTHDRNLPEAFRERTLDFYITLCHRLMKQRNELAEETDALLRACWSLAEMLFSLRQNKKDGKPADEELLGSAVQSCWELCDLFREGWTQVRPERGTPRPSQTTFTMVSDQMSRSSERSASAHSKSSLGSLAENPIHPPSNRHATRRFESETPIWNPETPTTEFEDTPVTPDRSPNIPNILVLGTEPSRQQSSTRGSWSTTSSAYSQGSAKSTSTITSTKQDEDINLTRLKLLILKAAMNIGFSRASPNSSSSNKSDPPALQSFVKGLPTSSFGPLPLHATLLTAYRNLVLSDPTFRSAQTLPPIGRKASAQDVAKSVMWMMRSGQYTFLKDLYRLVFGFHLDESEKRMHVSITV